MMKIPGTPPGTAPTATAVARGATKTPPSRERRGHHDLSPAPARSPRPSAPEGTPAQAATSEERQAYEDLMRTFDELAGWMFHNSEIREAKDLDEESLLSMVHLGLVTMNLRLAAIDELSAQDEKKLGLEIENLRGKLDNYRAEKQRRIDLGAKRAADPSLAPRQTLRELLEDLEGSERALVNERETLEWHARPRKLRVDDLERGVDRTRRQGQQIDADISELDRVSRLLRELDVARKEDAKLSKELDKLSKSSASGETPAVGKFLGDKTRLYDDELAKLEAPKESMKELRRLRAEIDELRKGNTVYGGALNRFKGFVRAMDALEREGKDKWLSALLEGQNEWTAKLSSMLDKRDELKRRADEALEEFKSVMSQAFALKQRADARLEKDPAMGEAQKP